MLWWPVPACGWTCECVLPGRIGAVRAESWKVVAGVRRGAVKDRPPVFVEGGRPASSGSGGTVGLVGWLEGGGWWWWRAGGFSNQETVTHCSLTPLAWVAKIVKSWTFINLPRRADWLEPGSVFFPPSSPSHRVNGIQCDCAEAAALRRQTWVSANNQASDALPRYWARGGGKPKVECGGSQRKLGTGGRAVGLSFEEEKVMIWACLQKDNNTDAITIQSVRC